MAGWKVPTEGNSTPNQISPTEKRTGECNKGKRSELEWINLPRRPSTPGPCPSISDEENEKCKRILKKAETGWQLWHGDGNRSNTGVMRNRGDEREVRKRNERMTGNSQKIVSADSVIYLDVLCCFSTWFAKENYTNAITKTVQNAICTLLFPILGIVGLES